MIKKYYKKIFLFLLMLIPVIALAISVETYPASYIGDTSARMDARFETGLLYDVNNMTSKFRYSTTAPATCQSMTGATEIAAVFVNTNISGGSVGIFFNQTATGLTPGTTYYFCGIATLTNNNNTSTYYGNVRSFATSGIAPGPVGPGNPGGAIPGDVGQVITVEPPTGVTDTEARFRGSVSGITGSAYGYFRYSTMATPPIFCNDIFGSNMRSIAAGTEGGNYSSGAVTNGSFSARAINLAPSTTYYYCAVVSNHASTPTVIKYGYVKSLRTLPCQTCEKTQIITREAKVLSGTSATLNGEYGSTKPVTTYFEYKSAGLGLQTNNPEQPTGWTKTPEESHGAGSYGKMLAFVSGLQPNTTYQVRAVGKTTNPAQTFYGQIVYFKTLSANNFGDDGWVHNGPLPPTIVISSNPFYPPGPECAQSSPDNPIQGCGNPNNPYNPYNPYNPNDPTNPYDPNNPYNPYNPNNTGGGYNPYGSGTGYNPYGGGSGYNPFGPTADYDGDGVTNFNDSDIDGDGSGNTSDSDADGDGIGNGFDTDDDNDGIFDSSDTTPLGNGSSQNDLDGDGLSNSVDTDDDGDGIPDGSDLTPLGTGSGINDLDGDGINNSLDTDIDGDGIPNNTDPDDDNDGLPDHLDNSASGSGTGTGGPGTPSPNQSGEPRIGDSTNPPGDAIVRYHEGVETVFIRQIMRNTALAKKYGYRDGEDLQKFSWYLAHFLGKNFGYVAKNRREVRVRFADVAAYELREVGTSTIVIESFDNQKNGKFTVTGVRKLNSLFKIIFKYEYYFLRRK